MNAWLQATTLRNPLIQDFQSETIVMTKYFLQIAGLALLGSIPLLGKLGGGNGRRRHVLRQRWLPIVLRQRWLRVLLQLLPALRLRTRAHVPHLLHHEEGDHLQVHMHLRIHVRTRRHPHLRQAGLLR